MWHTTLTILLYLLVTAFLLNALAAISLVVMTVGCRYRWFGKSKRLGIAGTASGGGD
jgi:hypothetical protein